MYAPITVFAFKHPSRIECKPYSLWRHKTFLVVIDTPADLEIKIVDLRNTIWPIQQHLGPPGTQPRLLRWTSTKITSSENVLTVLST